MRYDLLKVWPSGVILTFIGGFWINWLWIPCVVWIIIGMFSYALNGKKHVKEALISNLVFFLIAIILFGLSWLFDF